MHWVRVLEELEAERMAGLVVGNDPLFFLGDDPRAALRAEGDLLERLLKVDLSDLLLVAARGEDSSLVDDVGEVRAREARRDLPNSEQVDIVVEGLTAHVHVEDGLAALDVGAVEHDLAVEPAGPEERRVEDVRAVRGGDDDDVCAGVEAVHLDEDLVQRLLALVVRPAEAGATLTADRVDLVDEHDARRVALGLVKEIAHPGGADADGHLNELGARDREERDARLAGDGAREHRLPRAGRTY